MNTDKEGHGFKYAPIIGREILKVVKKTPSPEYAIRWSFNGDVAAGADTRRGVRKDLVLGDLATKADLKA
jgi:sarcosine oxidase/L-pipecolate oxidase